MKILMLEWKSFGNEDLISAFNELGHTVKTIPFSNKELHHDDAVARMKSAAMGRGIHLA